MPPRQPQISLAEAVALLGYEKLSKKLGVTPRTVKSWEKSGVSSKKRDLLAAVLVKVEASRQRNETRRTRLEIPLPPDWSYTEQKPGEFRPALTEEQARPVKAPRLYRYKQALRPFRSRTLIGTKQWVGVQKYVHDLEIEALISTAQYAHEMSGMYYVYVKFIFYRYIPFNPGYKGDAVLVSQQGTWQPWGGVPHRSDMSVARDLRENILRVFRGREKIVKDEIGRPRMGNVMGVDELAQRRFVWLAAMEIVCADSNPYKPKLKKKRKKSRTTT